MLSGKRIAWVNETDYHACMVGVFFGGQGAHTLHNKACFLLPFSLFWLLGALSHFHSLALKKRHITRTEYLLISMHMF